MLKNADPQVLPLFFSFISYWQQQPLVTCFLLAFEMKMARNLLTHLQLVPQPSQGHSTHGVWKMLLAASLTSFVERSRLTCATV